jgi:hypothetical protein
VTNGGWDLPNIPTLAAGGIVLEPTLAVIGEAGPEAVVPLGAGRAGVGGTVINNIHLNVQGSLRSDRDLVKVIRDEIHRGGLSGLAR